MKLSKEHHEPTWLVIENHRQTRDDIWSQTDMWSFKRSWTLVDDIVDLYVRRYVFENIIIDA